MTLAFIILILILYSFGGWILEVTYVFITTHRLVNRGFLFGPLCPIYGVGALLVVTALKPFSGNMFLLAFMGMISATALEYSTSWVMEKLFHTRWWDYSESKFNLNGRVCLENSITFGVLAVVITRILHPMVIAFFSLISLRVQEGLVLALFILVFIDCSLTLVTLLGFDKKLAQITQFIEEFFVKTEENNWFDPYNLKKSLTRLQKIVEDEKTDAHERQLESFRNVLRKSDGMNRILNSFPKMKNNKHTFNLDSYKSKNQTQRKR